MINLLEFRSLNIEKKKHTKEEDGMEGDYLKPTPKSNTSDDQRKMMGNWIWFANWANLLLHSLLFSTT